MNVRMCVCMYVLCIYVRMYVQGGSNMTGTDCGLFTHKSVPVTFEPPCMYVRIVHACVFTLARVHPPSSSTGPTNSMDSKRI